MNSLGQRFGGSLRLLRYYPRVLKLVWQANPRQTMWAVLLHISSAVVAPAQIWASKLLIDRITLEVQRIDTSVAPNWLEIFSPIAFILVLWIVGGVSRSLLEGISTLLAFHVGHHAEYLLLQKASQFDIAFYENSTFYDQMENAQRDIGRARQIAYLGLDFISAFFTLITVAILLIQLQPLLFLILFLTTAPQTIVEVYFGSRSHRIWMSRTSARRMAQYLAGLLGALGNRGSIKEMRVFGLQSVFLEKYRAFWQEFIDEIQGIQFAKEQVNALLMILSMLGTALVWAYAVVQAVLARITVGDVALVFQASERTLFELRRIFWTVGIFYEHSLFISNYFDFLDIEPHDVQGSLSRRDGDGANLAAVPNPIQRGIEFRNVSFKYPGADSFSLHNVSFRLHPGESVAVVGENGAGKTTLVKLLCRLYDPTAGAILLDGKDLRDYRLEDVRNSIGVIFQDFVRYDLSARENVGLGQVEFVDDLARVEQAAQLGGAAAIVDRLPNGFDSVLGRTFEGGVDLSGGEWQKFALSRAFMREAQILILDEPTAALDAFAEHEIYQRFAQLTEGKITVFISHRFSTVRIAQRILVLQAGRLAEEGAHHELMALQGEYATMFEIQARQYVDSFQKSSDLWER